MDDGNPVVPELLVEDVERSRAFSVEVLDFTVRCTRESFAHLSLGGAQLVLDGDHPGAWRTGPLEGPRGRGVDLQVEVPDARAVRDAVRAAGHPLFQDLTERRSTDPPRGAPQTRSFSLSHSSAMSSGASPSTSARALSSCITSVVSSGDTSPTISAIAGYSSSHSCFTVRAPW